MDIPCHSLPSIDFPWRRQLQRRTERKGQLLFTAEIRYMRQDLARRPKQIFRLRQGRARTSYKGSSKTRRQTVGEHHRHHPRRPVNKCHHSHQRQTLANTADARMQGCRDAGMQGCMDAGMQGCRDAWMQMWRAACGENKRWAACGRCCVWEL